MAKSYPVESPSRPEELAEGYVLAEWFPCPRGCARDEQRYMKNGCKKLYCEWCGMHRDIPEMSGPEFERYYNCGEMPERFWPEEIEKLREEYVTEKITLQQFEEHLDDLIGLTNVQPKLRREYSAN